MPVAVDVLVNAVLDAVLAFLLGASLFLQLLHRVVAELFVLDQVPNQTSLDIEEPGSFLMSGFFVAY